MKKLHFLIVALLFTALCLNVFGQTKSYPFEVKTTGKGKESVLFIPGFACSGQVWDGTKEFFEKKYTCHTLTMAGFAGVPAQENPTFKTWEKGIADYIRDKKLGKTVIVGHSMGGGLAMALAADYPELVAKIVVVDALPCLAALSNPNFKANDSMDCSPIVTRYKAVSDSQFYFMQKMAMKQMMADTAKQEQAAIWSVKSDRKTFAEMYCSFSNTDLREKISNVKCPSLILLESYFLNLKTSMDEQFKNMKTANIQYATKGLHFIMYDDKEWFQKQISNFIQ